MEKNPDLFCHDLPTQPIIGHKILITGATGYIGGELMPELLARGYQVRVMVRSFSPEHKRQWPGAEIVMADALELPTDKMDALFERIDASLEESKQQTVSSQKTA